METGFSFPGGCVCVNKNEQWKTKAALCSSLCREREEGEGVRRERERGYNGQDSGHVWLEGRKILMREK